ncbi:MAG: serine/threonine protein phosphatase [Verrucomicrobiota bacterium]
MEEAKNTQRSIVHLAYDGKVYKTFLGDDKEERFQNETRVLQFLEEQGCDFVPRVLEADETKLLLVTTNCGTIVDRISPEKKKQTFAELESYGVRHDDVAARNLTYRRTDGRFCVIDFEFATILDPDGNHPPPVDLNALRGAAKTERRIHLEHEDSIPPGQNP